MTSKQAFTSRALAFVCTSCEINSFLLCLPGKKISLLIKMPLGGVLKDTHNENHTVIDTLLTYLG